MAAVSASATTAAMPRSVAFPLSPPPLSPSLPPSSSFHPQKHPRCSTSFASHHHQRHRLFNLVIASSSRRPFPLPAPPQSHLLRLSPNAPSKCRKGMKVVMQASRSSPVPAVERILAGIGYFLPLFDGLQYGRYFFAQYPAAAAVFRPLFPILRVYTSIPFTNFVAFFALYLGVVRNPSFSRYVRFNAMQACVLDILIILPMIIQRILSPRSGMALDLLVIFYNTIFIFLIISFLFGLVSCVLGKTPRLPIVADAAENQL